MPPSVTFISQPPQAIGELVQRELAHDDLREVVISTAWTSRNTLARFGTRLAKLASDGVTVKFLVGIDLMGTSREVLQDLLSLGIESWVVSDRRPGHTFHPKLFYTRSAHEAQVLMGSFNFTDGGLWRNYEIATQVEFSLPSDQIQLEEFIREMPFARPADELPATPLTSRYIGDLFAWGLIPTERERQANQSRNLKRLRSPGAGASQNHPLRTGNAQAAPGLPSSTVRARSRGTGASAASGIQLPAPTLNQANSFYMTLAAPANGNIPGEQRIPLGARDAAPGFWGWPDEYQHVVTPKSRYQEWRPDWNIQVVGNVHQQWSGQVRMYYYPRSSDFRFHAGELNRLGANRLDIVRISHASTDPTVFDCELVKQGSGLYDRYLSYCTESTPGSDRRWGYS